MTTQTKDQNQSVLHQESALVYPSDSSLTIDQQQTAAEALGYAFSQDPFMAYLLPDTTTRVRKMTKLFLPMIGCSLRYGGVEVTPEGGGALAWISGSYYPLSFPQMARSGLLWIPAVIGLSAMKRLYAHEIDCERALNTHAPSGFAYLWVVGVHPHHVGQGLGKQMIQSALETMRQRGHSDCLLRTENPKNVALYEHLGFKTIHYGTPSSSKLPYWLLSQTLV